MTYQRTKAVFFVFLLLSAHAFRIQTSEASQTHTRGGLNSTAVQRQAPIQQGALQASYAYSSSFSSTTVVATSSGSYTRTSITAISEYCAPGLYKGPELIPHDPGILASVSPMWPVLIATAVVLMGGLYMYHQHRTNGPVETAFCPVSSWEPDPVGTIVGSSWHAGSVFGAQFAAFLSEPNNHGMPKCHGLRRHRLRADCDGDVDCKRQACRQMCCDRRDCTFFQFNAIDRTDNCWLGSRSRLSIDSCEQPFFGETCTTCRDRRMALWPQMHEENMKCSSRVFGYTGFRVENQYECQAHAVEQGHEYYQYDASRQRCETEATCDSPSRHTIHNWRIFSSQDVPPPPPAAPRPPPDQEVWQFEPFLFHENRDFTTVRLVRSERCDAGDVTCMRDACRAQCLQHDWCIHHQFKNNGDSCHLGAAAFIEEDNVQMWFGGILAHDRSCASDEYKCPSSHDCMGTCSDCVGHSRDGPEGWCMPTVVESMVSSENWVLTYNTAYSEQPIDAWCRGTERTLVTVSHSSSSTQTGADICRAACSSNPQCALWQMYPGEAERLENTEGGHVRCWLGMEDKVGNPSFSCTGRSPRRWRLLASPTAEAVATRGCTHGQVACVLTSRCVHLCQDECPGFSTTDTEAGLCQPPTRPAMISPHVPMNVGIAANLPPASPIGPDNSMFADEGDWFTLTVNIREVIKPDSFEGDTTSVCDVIANANCDLREGACQCEYDDETDCGSLFGHQDRILPIVTAEGMMVLSHQGCSCVGRMCTLQLMDSVACVRIGEGATSAACLGDDEPETCDTTLTCPDMDTCEPISFGGPGCGYKCDNAEGHHWCSSRCACHNANEPATDCPSVIRCPRMDHCDPISYGDYGCGYGCTQGSTYHFCNADCTVCDH